MVRKFLTIFFCFFIFLACHPAVFANLYINEFSSYSSSDWIELYNSGQEDRDLSKYCIRDSSSTNKLVLNGVLGSGQFTSFDWSDKLNKSGDDIKLFLNCDESQSPEDQVKYLASGGDINLPGENQTAGRSTDGGGHWVLFASATRGGPNSALVVPTVTPTPTEAPVPTRTPTPTRIPTPTRVPTTTKTPTPTLTPTVKPENTQKPSLSPTKMPTIIISKANLKPTITGGFDDILGISTKSARITSPVKKKQAKPEVLVQGSSSINYSFIVVPAVIAILFISSGIIVFLKIRNKQKETNNKYGL